MSSTLAPEQVNQIVNNLHQNPFEILGAHPLEQNGKVKSWVVRAYLPKADAAWVVCPEERTEYPMHIEHNAHFFVCTIETGQLSNYQLRIKEGDRDKVIYDPYAFDSPHLSDVDIHLFAEGNHHRIYEKLGAHLTTLEGVPGVYFALWAPNARNVSILGDFNSWDGREHQMRKGGNGIWELFIPELKVGTAYKYEIKNWEGHIYEKSDPYGFHQEVRPKTASIVADLEKYEWQDNDWLEQRRANDPLNQPISVYEIHLGSWMHAPFADKPQLLSGEGEAVAVSEWNEDARFLTYYELVDKLIPYVKELGYTHIEVLPIAEHPFDGSWGYQVTGYYAPTSRYGNPEDLMYNEVKNFLIANALFWFDKYHIDGIRVDAVASMLYLNYAREDGEWIANEYGGAENLDAVEFLRHVNSLLFSYFPGTLSIAEESTAWPMVSWPTYTGGLGFNLKWNMGWMHDNLDYFSMDAWFRQFHQNNVTFSMWYHHSENYMLALSHDEIVHGKSNLIGKVPGDEWQKFANIRALFGYMFTHPGKKTMFMSMEFGQWNEWNVWTDLDWDLLQHDHHQQLKQFFSDLNGLYKSETALYDRDFEEPGFDWIDCTDNNHSVVSFLRRSKNPNEFLVVVCNFTPQPHSHYRIGVPEAGYYNELFNSDAGKYGGSNMGNMGGKWTDEWSFHNLPYSLDLCLPPLSVMVFKIDRAKTAQVLQGS